MTTLRSGGRRRGVVARLRSTRVLGVVALAALVVAAALIGVALSRGSAQADTPTTSPAWTPAQLDAPAADNWLTAGGGIHDNRYSSLADINTGNVAGLTQAWQAHMGLSAKTQALTSEEASPIAYNGVLYVPDGQSNVYAFNGATGALLWKHDSNLESPPFITAVRGLAIGEGKVYAPQGDGYITALDETNGNVVWKTRVGISTEGYSFTSPAVYYNGMVIEGASGGDVGGRSFVVALDAKTGLELWRWYVAPSPGEIGSGTWPGIEWQHGGGAIWISPSVDPDTGLLYVVTGNPVPWNGRGPGDDKWTDSIVALHVQNGQFAWGFQTVHHDIWDYDVTNPPVLFEASYNGVMRKGIAVASKTGWVYILDRTTGQPLIGIPEKKVPQISGEGKNFVNLAKTQPYPAGDAFVNQCAKKSWFPKKAPDGKPLTVGCIFTPYTVSSKGSFVAFSPSAEGGVDWPPSAYNPQNNLMYVCARDGAQLLGAIPKNQQHLEVGKLYVGVNFGAASKTHPDTGAVVAMNVLDNKVAWKVKWPKPCFSGMMTTAGGLVFVGKNQQFQALDANTGNTLWTSPTLASGASAPSIAYKVNGKEYVAIVAGGATLGPTKAGDSIYAFQLP